MDQRNIGMELQTLEWAASGMTVMVQHELKWQAKNSGSLEEASHVWVVFFSSKKSIFQSLLWGGFMD